MSTCLPYPFFKNHAPVDAAKERVALSAVGRCRVDPRTLPASNSSSNSSSTDASSSASKNTPRRSVSFAAILAKNEQQAHVDYDPTATAAAAAASEEERKKLRKKYLKEGIALAQSYLQETLLLDPSVVDVEMVLSADDIMATDGCLASCFLDAGCQRIVMDCSSSSLLSSSNTTTSTNTPHLRFATALDAAKIPKDRLMASFQLGHLSSSPTEEKTLSQLQAVTKYCDFLNVAYRLPSDADLDSNNTAAQEAERILKWIQTLATNANANANTDANHTKNDPLAIVLELILPSAAAATTTLGTSGTFPTDALVQIVSSVCTQIEKWSCQSSSSSSSNSSSRIAPGTTVCLVDPTVDQLGQCYAACLKTDRTDGLYTTVVCTRNGEALGLVYSSQASIVAALASGRGVYYSRSRQGLWRKGDTSGHFQTLHRLDVDCDGDALRFTVTQRGEGVDKEGNHCGPSFCHLNTLTCWGKPRGLRHLEETLQERLKSAPKGSYTKRLFEDEELLRDKLVEEAQELSEADTKEHIAEELADVLYFAMVRAAKAGVSLDDAAAELDRRSRKVTRRKGDSKAFRIAAGKEILEKK